MEDLNSFNVGSNENIEIISSNVLDIEDSTNELEDVANEKDSTDYFSEDNEVVGTEYFSDDGVHLSGDELQDILADEFESYDDI